MRKLIVAAAGAALLCAAAAAEPPKRDAEERDCPADAVHLLILGSYHMDNPRLDAVNLEADDVLTARRQAEIERLNASLLRFAPTKVAIEGDRSRTTWPDRYRDWLAGRYTLGRNEIEQIAMRVARRAGHQTIYPIDFPMLMNGLRYDEVDLKPKAAPAPAAAAAAPRELTEEEKLLRRLTVSENLRRMNDASRIASDHAGYMNLLFPKPDQPLLYERADLLTNWYKRNVRMMSNIARVSAPGDRVLLVVGSGHLAILRDFALDAPRFCLADTLHYLPER